MIIIVSSDEGTEFFTYRTCSKSEIVKITIKEKNRLIIGE